MTCKNGEFINFPQFYVPNMDFPVKTLIMENCTIVAQPFWFAKTKLLRITITNSQLTLKENSLAGREFESFTLDEVDLQPGYTFANTQINHFEISYSKISKIESNAFKNATFASLTVSYNHIDSIEENAFAGACITEFYIQYNKIGMIKTGAITLDATSFVEFDFNEINTLKKKSLKFTNKIESVIFNANKFNTIESEAISVDSAMLSVFNFGTNQIINLSNNALDFARDNSNVQIFHNSITRLFYQDFEVNTQDVRIKSNYFDCQEFLCDFIPYMKSDSKNLFNLMLTEQATCKSPIQMEGKSPLEIYYKFKVIDECKAAIRGLKNY